MWSKCYSRKMEGLNANQIWDVWTDVNQWHTWRDDIKSAKLGGDFKQSTSNPKEGRISGLNRG